MSEVTQVPGVLDIEIQSGDDFACLLDFNISLTSYTFTASINLLLSDDVTISVAETDLSAGKITISVTDTQTAAIQPGSYSWKLRGTISGYTRTFLQGRFIVN